LNLFHSQSSYFAPPLKNLLLFLPPLHLLLISILLFPSIRLIFPFFDVTKISVIVISLNLDLREVLFHEFLENGISQVETAFQIF